MTVASPYADRLAAIAVGRDEIEISGTRTAYWVYGDPAAPITIVAVHGYRGDHHGLEPVVAYLDAVSYTHLTLPTN